MEYMARWGPKGFICSPGKVLPIMEFSTQKSAKTETQTEESGTDTTNIKGLESYKLDLSTRCLRAAGISPRGQVDEWEALVGIAYPLYIGGERFGPAKMFLKSVKTSDYLFDNVGRILALSIDLSFEEYNDKKTTTPVKSSAGPSTGSSGSGSSGTVSEPEKKKALTCTASASDRRVKNSYHTVN